MKKPFAKKPNLTTPRFAAVLTQKSYKYSILVLVLLALVLFGGSGYYWYRNVFTNPDRILSDMLTKSMQTKSLYRTISQDGGQSTVNQNVYVSFTPNTLAQSVTDLQEQGTAGKTSVTTETLGTKTTDYVRYKSVDIAGNDAAKSKFESVVNVWGKRDANTETGESVTFLTDSLFVAVPFGNLNADQRKQVSDEIKAVNLYQIANTKKEYKDGRPVMNYSISLDPQALVKVLAKYAEVTGVGNSAELDPAQYEGSQKLQVSLQVDMLSRHVNIIQFVGSNRTETYGAYNATRTVELPQKTIGIDELQSRVSEVEQSTTTSGN